MMYYDPHDDQARTSPSLPAATRAHGPVPPGTRAATGEERKAILHVWERHPRWGRQQIYTEIRFTTRMDIPVAVIQAVMEQLDGKPVLDS